MRRGRSLVGLIGANIQRSLSPALHEDAFQAAGIVGHYHLIDLDRLNVPADLRRLLNAVRMLGFAGVNITHPCKEAVIPLLDEIGPDAAEVGAVNTVVIGAKGRTTGHNTDRIGFLRSFEAQLGRSAVEGGAVLLIGAGGAGRAVAHALCDLGARRIAVHDKEHDRAAALAGALRASRRYAAAPVADLGAALRDVCGVVNATPVGMAGYPGEPLPPDLLRPEIWVADVVYTPLETQLIAAARRRGCRVLTGGGMCVHQAAAAFRLFTGISPDIRRMEALFNRLAAGGGTALAAVG